MVSLGGPIEPRESWVQFARPIGLVGALDGARTSRVPCGARPRQTIIQDLLREALRTGVTADKLTGLLQSLGEDEVSRDGEGSFQWLIFLGDLGVFLGIQDWWWRAPYRASFFTWSPPLYYRKQRKVPRLPSLCLGLSAASLFPLRLDEGSWRVVRDAGSSREAVKTSSDSAAIDCNGVIGA